MSCKEFKEYPETFKDFEELASDSDQYRRIGFPANLRASYEKAIHEDIKSKMNGLSVKNSSMLDIGAGASNFYKFLVNALEDNGGSYTALDSQAVLDTIPDPRVMKVCGRFPDSLSHWLKDQASSYDYILVYSVLQYVIGQTCVFKFLDSALDLLKPGGIMLIGDIPNHDMKIRLNRSEEGRLYHAKFYSNYPYPEEDPWLKSIPDDSTILSLVSRARKYGYDAWVQSQADNLPFSNRREDIIIRRRK